MTISCSFPTLASLTCYYCDEWHPCLVAYTWTHAPELSGTKTSLTTYTEEDELSTRKEFTGGGARFGHPRAQLSAVKFYLDALKFNLTMKGLDPSCPALEPASSRRSWRHGGNAGLVGGGRKWTFREWWAYHSHTWETEVMLSKVNQETKRTKTKPIFIDVGIQTWANILVGTDLD